MAEHQLSNTSFMEYEQTIHNNTALHRTTSRFTCNGSWHYPGPDRCETPLYLFYNYYQHIINGYIMPPLVLFTLATNSLICAVLMSRRMRSPSNTILVAMAVSDMLTGVWTLPAYIHFFTLGAQYDYVPYKWCTIYYWLTDYLPTSFHTASVWLTVALAAQRYMFICHHAKFKNHFGMRNMLRVITCIFIFSFATQLMRAGENRFVPIEVRSRARPGEVMIGCVHDIVPQFSAMEEQIYFSALFWFRLIFVHLLPCISLVALNLALTCAMRVAVMRMRRLLHRQSRRSECRRLQETNATTLLLIVVVALFLLVELPLAFFIVTMVIENNLDRPLINIKTRETAELFLNLLVLLSYPLNFFIYCAMSRQFRETFSEICTPNASWNTSDEVPVEEEMAGLNGKPHGKARRDLRSGVSSARGLTTWRSYFNSSARLAAAENENGTKETKI